MAAINTGNFGKLLWPGLNQVYGDSYKEYPVEWKEIFSVNKSRKAFEEDMSTSWFGLAQQMGEGQSVSYDVAQQGFVDRYTHVKYGLGFIITKEMVEDDQYDVIGNKKAKALAFSMRQTRETVAANILNRAFNSNYTYGDGKELCNSVRPNVRGGTWSNIISVAADISETTLEQAVIDIAKFKNDASLAIAVRPRKIVIPVDQQFEVEKIMKTEYEVGTNNNTVNVVRHQFPGGVVVNHYLTDTDAWFILTDVSDGMKCFERRAEDFSMDDDFDTDNAKFKATARYSYGATDKRCIYGSAGA